MKITLTGGKSAPRRAVQELEAALGSPICESFRHFVGENDGSEPQSNRFPVCENNSSGVNQFIPISQILEERQHIENVPRHAYPIAWAEGGNYVLLDEGKGGKVYFWDHELPEDIIKLADNFHAFLSMLEPFDINSIKLKPRKVKSVWVNAELLKRFKIKLRGR